MIPAHGGAIGSAYKLVHMRVSVLFAFIEYGLVTEYIMASCYSLLIASHRFLLIFDVSLSLSNLKTKVYGFQSSSDSNNGDISLSKYRKWCIFDFMQTPAIYKLQAGYDQQHITPILQIKGPRISSDYCATSSLSMNPAIGSFAARRLRLYDSSSSSLIPDWISIRDLFFPFALVSSLRSPRSPRRPVS